MGIYEAPNGEFALKIPVLGELGGQVREFNGGVLFFDAFTTHIAVLHIPMDATQRWELSTQGAKDYLVNFFAGAILPQYRSTGKEITVQSAKFLPSRNNGTVLTYTIQDGGSFFNNRLAFFGESDVLPKAKRGHMVFIKNEALVVISVELGEKSTERSLYKATQAEEDEVLKNRLIEISDSIVFKSQATAPAAAAK